MSDHRSVAEEENYLRDYLRRLKQQKTRLSQLSYNILGDSCAQHFNIPNLTDEIEKWLIRIQQDEGIFGEHVKKLIQDCKEYNLDAVQRVITYYDEILPIDVIREPFEYIESPIPFRITPPERIDEIIIIDDEDSTISTEIQCKRADSEDSEEHPSEHRLEKSLPPSINKPTYESLRDTYGIEIIKKEDFESAQRGNSLSKLTPQKRANPQLPSRRGKRKKKVPLGQLKVDSFFAKKENSTTNLPSTSTHFEEEEEKEKMDNTKIQAKGHCKSQTKSDILSQEKSDIIQKKFRHVKLNKYEKCIICLEKMQEYVQIDCAHKFHSQCIHKYLKIEIAKIPRRLAVCPIQECRKLISDSSLTPILGKKATEKYDKNLFKQATQESNMFHCPTADCQNVVELTKDSPEIFFCTVCHTNYCTKCSNKEHEGQTCKEYEISNSRSKEDRKLASLIKNQKNYRTCPKCRQAIEKGEGCNHIICPSCKYNFCFECGGEFGKCPCRNAEDKHFKRIKQAEERRKRNSIRDRKHSNKRLKKS